MAIDECTASATNCDDCVVGTNRANLCEMMADCFGWWSMPEFERVWYKASAINCDDVSVTFSRGRDYSMAVNL